MSSLNRLRLWDRVLLVVVSLVAVYAVGLVALGLTIGDVLFDPLGFGPDDGDITSDTSRSYLRLIFAVLGSVIVGWMITIAAIVVGPLARRERWAWNATVVATLTWFILDTGASLLLGFVGHALFNIGFGIALAVPLAVIRREMTLVASRSG